MGVIQKNGFWNTVIGYAGVALGFVSAVILFPRLLTPEEVGLTNVFRGAAAILSQLCAMGGSSVVLRFFPFFRTEDGRYNGIFTLSLLLSLAGVLIFSILYLVFKPLIVDYYSAKSGLFVQYCMFVIPISAASVFYSLFSAWLRSMMKVLASAVYIEIVMRCATMLAVLVYATGWISFDAFVWLFAMSFAVPGIGMLIHCWRCGFLSFDFEITPQIRKYWKAALGYGIFCLFAGTGTTMVGNIDSMMLGRLGLEGVAVYGIVLNFLSVIQMPYRALLSISSPLVAEYWQKNYMRKMLDLYQKFSLNIIIITLLMFLGIWANIDVVYSIMPPVYATGKWALLILFVGKFIDIATGLNGIILGTSKKYRWDLWFAVALIILAIGTNTIFIPLYGLEGAALATTISIAAVNLARLLVVYKYYKMQPFTRPIWSVLLLAIAAWLLIWITPVPQYWMTSLAIRSVMVCALFGLPVYLLKLSPDFNTLIDSVISMAVKIFGIKHNG